jgi:hypothetical protein
LGHWWSATAVQESNNELERHHQVTKELKTIGILTAILLPLLVIMAIVLRNIG